jgi:histidyl-tRNA synthetase
LFEHFSARRADLSQDSRERLDRNPLRILDSKAHEDWPIADSAPAIDEFLTHEASDFFAAVTSGLDAAGVAWERAPRLVRGLDYYRHTAFEFMTDQLGAQGTVIAGGRYDGLIESLGGPHTPAIGWAAGIERLAMMIEMPGSSSPTIAVIADKPDYQAEATKISAHLRGRGVSVVSYFAGTGKKQTDRARREGVDAVLFVRDLNRTRSSNHLSHSAQSKHDGTDLLLKVLGRMPPEYGEMSGDDHQ